MKETLEEAIKREYEARKFNSDFPFDPQSFKLGAKWQQEQDKNKYSEEEVLQIINKTLIEYSDYTLADIPNWFKQFKKK